MKQVLLKKSCTNCRQEVEFYGVGRGFVGPQGAGMGQQNFPRHGGEAGIG